VRKFNRRNGFTLIEMVLMLSLLSMTTAASLTIVDRLTKLSKQTQDSLRTDREVLRFAKDLRSLAHQSLEYELSSDGRSVTFQWKDETRVEIELQADGVGIENTNGEKFSRERYELKIDESTAFAVDGAMLSITIGKSSGMAGNIQIDAAMTSLNQTETPE